MMIMIKRSQNLGHGSTILLNKEWEFLLVVLFLRSKNTLSFLVGLKDLWTQRSSLTFHILDTKVINQLLGFLFTYLRFFSK